MADLLPAVLGLAPLALAAVYPAFLFKDATLRQRAAITLFPISQFAMATFLFVVVEIGSLGAAAALAVSAACIACFLANVLLFKAIRQSLRRRLEEERTRLLAEQLDAQKAYAELLSEEARQAAAIRKRLGDDLKSIESALASGSQELAEERIVQASDALRGPRRPFCRNRAIDALMSEKARLCNGAGIELSCSLDVRDDLPFSPVDLCALFGNAMDNAIEASSRCAPGRRRVKARAGEAAGLFVLEVENTFEATGESPFDARKGRGLAEHGWGRAILEDIASRNDGSIDIEKNDGTYRLAITLAL